MTPGAYMSREACFSSKSPVVGLESYQWGAASWEGTVTSILDTENSTNLS